MFVLVQFVVVVYLFVCLFLHSMKAAKQQTEQTIDVITQKLAAIAILF